MNMGDNFEVFVAPAQGGEARRLTWHPKDDYPVDWSHDGKQILFRSHRIYDGTAQLFSIAAQGGFETQLPFPLAWNGSFSPDGARIAYSPTNDPTFAWRNYRGGTSAPIWMANLSDSAIEPLPRRNSNDRSRCGSATKSISSPIAAARRIYTAMRRRPGRSAN